MYVSINIHTRLCMYVYISVTITYVYQYIAIIGIKEIIISFNNDYFQS